MKPPWQFQLMLTERCCLQCPECALNTPYIKAPQDMTPVQVESVSRYIQGIPDLHLTGGEPLVNPWFDEIVTHLRKWANPETLALSTNAIFAPQHAEALRHFDYIVCTLYSGVTYSTARHPYHADNATSVYWLKEFCAKEKKKLTINHGPHVPRSKRGTKPCAKAEAGVVIYYPNELLYPCCVGQGTPNAIGIPVTENWRTEIQQVPVPCKDCFFAEP